METGVRMQQSRKWSPCERRESEFFSCQLDANIYGQMGGEGAGAWRGPRRPPGPDLHITVRGAPHGVCWVVGPTAGALALGPWPSRARLQPRRTTPMTSALTWPRVDGGWPRLSIACWATACRLSSGPTPPTPPRAFTALRGLSRTWDFFLFTSSDFSRIFKKKLNLNRLVTVDWLAPETVSLGWGLAQWRRPIVF